MNRTTQNHVMFIEFCEFCENISEAKREKKEEIFKKYLFNYRKKHDDNFYRVLRFLLPNLDRERSAYGIKESTLAKLYIRILCLDKQSKDAKKLINFRSPKNAGSSAGDFAEVAYEVLKVRCADGNKLTIDDVHIHLDNIALKNAENKKCELENELTTMARQMSAEEQKWLIRIVLKDMKIGFGHIKLLSLFHPDAKELYDVSQSLVKVCNKLKDPSVRLHEIEITLFEPFRPMLAERCDVQNIEKHFEKKSGKWYVEEKLDGERSQLHYSEGKFKYISRNGFDFTEHFGSDSVSGSLSPHLTKQIKSSVKSFILDGEMMPWNSKYKSFGNKGMNIDVKYLRVGHWHQPCLCVFDVLYFNGKVLSNHPLHQRLAVLEHIFTPLEGIIMHTSRKEVNSSLEVLNALNEAIDNQEEGIVVKDPNSIYKPSARREGWIKIKPEYTPGAMVELDMLIIGGYFGEGRKRGIVSHFLLGLAVPPDLPGSDPVVFESVCRVGSGCTMEELAELGKKIEKSWRKLKTGECPHGLKWTREKPELWIEPQNSVVLQVKATEIVKSDEYQVGCTLRFPRIEKVRYDKPWRDCLTTDEFFKLQKESSGKLCTDHISQTSPTKKRKIQIPRRIVGAQLSNSELNSVKTITSLFLDKEICVLTAYDRLTKQELEVKVKENGGNVVQNPGTETYCVIVGRQDNIRVRNICLLNKYNVVKAEWLMNCLDSGTLVPWKPSDMITKSPETAEQLALLYDKYDCSYTEPITIEALEWSLEKIKNTNINEEEEPPSQKELEEVENLLFNDENKYYIFRSVNAYFGQFETGKSMDKADLPLFDAILKFKSLSGKVVNEINENTTHVIVRDNDFSHFNEAYEIKVQKNLNFFIVKHSWVLESWAAEKKLNEELYGF
uniref:DNA ligase 4 n=1 Tax=Clastoptera arizonana TaxID=38151 RepID=A0A1B6DLF5_9HEMI